MWLGIGSRTTRAAGTVRPTRSFSPVVMSRFSNCKRTPRALRAVLTTRRAVMPGSTRVTKPAPTVWTSFVGKSTIRTTGAMRNGLLVRSLLRPVWAGLARRARGDRRLVYPFKPFWPDSFRTREHPRLRRCHQRWSTMVHGSQKCTIIPCGLLMLELKGRRRSVPFARPSKLLRRRLGSSAAAPTIEADMVRRHVLDDGLVVAMSDDAPIHFGNGGVVEEHATIPIFALVAD